MVDGAHKYTNPALVDFALMEAAVAEATSIYRGERPIEPSRSSSDNRGMDTAAELAVLKHRADQADARMERVEGKLDRVLDGLSEMKAQLAALGASLPSKDTIRGWGLGLVAAVVGTAIAVAALVVSMQANNLSAFQAGLSAVQAAASGSPTPSQPIILQLPAPAAPPVAPTPAPASPPR